MRAFFSAVFAWILSNRSLVLKVVAALTGLGAASEGYMMYGGDAARDPVNFTIVGGGILGSLTAAWYWLKTRPIGKAVLAKALSLVKRYVATQRQQNPEAVSDVRDFALEVLPDTFDPSPEIQAQVEAHVAALARLATNTKYGEPAPELEQAAKAAAFPADPEAD